MASSSIPAPLGDETDDDFVLAAHGRGGRDDELAGDLGVSESPSESLFAELDALS